MNQQAMSSVVSARIAPVVGSYTSTPLPSTTIDSPPISEAASSFLPPFVRGAMSFGTRFAHDRLTAIGGCQDGRRKASQRAGGSAAGYTDDSADAAPPRSAAQRGNPARSCCQSAALLQPLPQSPPSYLLPPPPQDLSPLPPRTA